MLVQMIETSKRDETILGIASNQTEDFTAWKNDLNDFFYFKKRVLNSIDILANEFLVEFMPRTLSC